MPRSDFDAILRCLNACRAKYLVVGGYAVMRHTEPRFTKDLDLWIDNSPANTERVLSALRRFGAPLAGVSAADLERPERVLQIGVAPVRVDILTTLPGLRFQDAWRNRDTIRWEGARPHFISKADLIRAKRSAGRPPAGPSRSQEPDEAEVRVYDPIPHLIDGLQPWRLYSIHKTV